MILTAKPQLKMIHLNAQEATIGTPISVLASRNKTEIVRLKLKVETTFAFGTLFPSNHLCVTASLRETTMTLRRTMS